MGYPPLLPHQQLDFATKTMKTPKPVPFKRIKISGSSTSLATDIETTAKGRLKLARTLHLKRVMFAEIETSDNPAVCAETDTTGTSGNPIDLNDSIEDKEVVEEAIEEIPEEAKPTKLISVGSPVPDSYKFSKPPLEKWSENNTMVDLIYFENLPTSTGYFDKMRSVLGGIRNRLFSVAQDIDDQKITETESGTTVLEDTAGNPTECTDANDNETK